MTCYVCVIDRGKRKKREGGRERKKGRETEREKERVGKSTLENERENTQNIIYTHVHVPIHTYS